MYMITMLALLGIAEANTPKKKTPEKKEESAAKKKKTTKSTTKNTKPSTKKASPAKSSPKAKSNTKKPAGTEKATHNPAQTQAGVEHQNQPSAHQPIGAGQQTYTPDRTRAPDNIERPQVGNEHQNQPEAHSPIGNHTEPRGPGRVRAPENVGRPQVGNEHQNQPEAHSPIGSNQPQGPGRIRGPEHIERPQVGNEPQNQPEAHEPIGGPERRPERTGPRRDRETREPTTPVGTRTVPNNPAPEQSNRIERTPPSNNKQTPEFKREYSGCQQDCDEGMVATNPPKYQRSPAKQNSNRPNVSTTRKRNSSTGASSDIQRGSQGLIGLGTLSYASDYVDGGAYEDGGMGFSIGYRPIPQLEIEGAYGRYTDSLLEGSRERLNRPLQVTGQLHPFANALFSPFLVGGYVWNDVILNDAYIVDGDEMVAEQEGVLEGLVLGGGLTLNIHQNIALELDGRLFQYNNIETWEPAGDTATLVSMGVVVGF